MSRTPSPTKRSILSPKPHNINSGFKSNRVSPLRKLAKVSVVTKKKKVSAYPNFQIWEDPKPRQDANVEVDNIHQDQENILQPKKISIHRSNRVPLQPLSINEYPGFISYGSTSAQLTQLYQPSNYDNLSKSIHKFTNLPNFVTPPRKTNRYLVKSNEIDELDLHLSRKSNKLHQRSNSVGKNDLKLNLIKKNSFAIAPIVT